MKIKMKKLSSTALTPTLAHDGDAGYDLFADETYVLYPGRRYCVKTGISMSIPKGYYGRIAPRSGLAVKQGIDILAGVIDSCYRGEIGAVVINLGESNFTITKGEAIAQMIFEKCEEVEFDIETKLDDTNRGEKGYGSSDNKENKDKKLLLG